MAIYVYSPKLTPACISLLSGLDAKRLANFDGMHFRHKGPIVEFAEGKDSIVCWGNHVPAIKGVTMLNSSLLNPNQLFINKNFAKQIRTVCPYFAQVVETTDTNYDKHMAILKTGDSLNKLRHMAMKEFPGYLGPYYRGMHYKLHVFRDKILYAGVCQVQAKGSKPWYVYEELAKPPIAISTMAIAILKQLNLDFAQIALVAHYEDANIVILRKVLTAPEADNEIMSKYISEIRKAIDTSSMEATIAKAVED